MPLKVIQQNEQNRITKDYEKGRHPTAFIGRMRSLYNNYLVGSKIIIHTTNIIRCHDTEVTRKKSKAYSITSTFQFMY